MIPGHGPREEGLPPPKRRRGAVLEDEPEAGEGRGSCRCGAPGFWQFGWANGGDVKVWWCWELKKPKPKKKPKPAAGKTKPADRTLI